VRQRAQGLVDQRDERSVSLTIARDDLVAKESLGFAYVDGNHYFDPAMLDLILWSERVRPGGMIAAHDARLAALGATILGAYATPVTA
jgi:hypothetical protein